MTAKFSVAGQTWSSHGWAAAGGRSCPLAEVADTTISVAAPNSLKNTEKIPHSRWSPPLAAKTARKSPREKSPEHGAPVQQSRPRSGCLAELAEEGGQLREIGGLVIVQG